MVMFLRGYHFQPAFAELVRRYWAKVQGQVTWLARKCELPRGEWDDARQEAFLTLEHAIRSYDLEQPKGPGLRQRESFRCWLHRLVADSFRDYLKGQRRRERRLHRFVDMTEAVDDGPDPASEAVDNEMWDRTRAVAQQLGGDYPYLWRLMVGGMRSDLIAWHLDISLDALKHRRRKLLPELRRALRREV